MPESPRKFRDVRPSLADLFPGLPPDELERVQDRIDRYLTLALAVYEDLKADPARYAEFRRLLTSDNDLEKNCKKAGE